MLWTLPCLLVLLLAACQEQHTPPAFPPPEVTVQHIEAKTIPIEWDFVGQTESSRLVEIRTRIEGVIDKRLFEEGTLVRKGQVLYQLDDRSFAAALQGEKGNLAQQVAKQKNAKRDEERLNYLISEKAVSQKDLDDAVSALTEADAAVQTAKANVTTAELNLSYATITSPLTGLTGQSKKADGSFISPGQDGLLTTVTQTDPMWVKFSASETRLLKVSEAVMKNQLLMPENSSFVVQLHLADGSTYPVDGTLNFSDKQYSTDTGTREFRATFTNPEMRLVPGQFVRVKLKGAKRPNAILVPQRSVLQGQQGKYLYVVGPDDKAEIRPVEMGDWYNDEWIVESGLQSGERVIVDGVSHVAPNMPVKPQQAAADSSRSQP
ncbi:efflux RND transporter periplasmic adaptor subunit [Methylomonas sp. EbA]|uniref:Efflux RND transporter periplasmic adaptor subunit n=1 Tax=Methylomonas albis TaxID=1854563 RepID=A0ABR9D4I1_9GAMM|nr:efflux RND transporter periplasmic adaptor subunit [Methylomonas albis]